MVDEHGLMRRELADQGLHPNAAGYAVMAPLAARAIKQALAGSEAAPRCRRSNDQPRNVATSDRGRSGDQRYVVYEIEWRDT